MKFGMVLATIINPIILGFIFLFIFTPIGLFFKLIKRDELGLKVKKISYWKNPNSFNKNSSSFKKSILVFMDLIKEIWEFLKTRKKLWLAPIIFILMLFRGLLILVQGTVVAPSFTQFFRYFLLCIYWEYRLFIMIVQHV